MNKRYNDYYRRIYAVVYLIHIIFFLLNILRQYYFFSVTSIVNDWWSDKVKTHCIEHLFPLRYSLCFAYRELHSYWSDWVRDLNFCREKARKECPKGLVQFYSTIIIKKSTRHSVGKKEEAKTFSAASAQNLLWRLCNSNSDFYLLVVFLGQEGAQLLDPVVDIVPSSPLNWKRKQFSFKVLNPAFPCTLTWYLY